MLIRVPGRTELAGNHTDHQGGAVLAAAIDLFLEGEAEACADAVEVDSGELGSFSFPISQLEAQYSIPGTAEALARGVLEYLRDAGWQPGGFRARLRSDIPVGAGLSSSAAFGVWIGRSVSNLYHDGKIPPLTLAKAAQYGENVHFGKPCGLMDQCACAFGGVLAIDFSDSAKPEVRSLSADPGMLGWDMLIVRTGESHQDLTEDYASITGEMGAIAAHFGKCRLSELKEVDIISEVPVLRSRYGDRAVLRALHFFAEDRRAREMSRALEAGDMGRYLALMDESGRSSAELLQNSYSIADPARQGIPLALAIARRSLGGEGAARVHGGGFAGCVQVLCPPEKTDGCILALEAVFGSGCCYRLRVV